MQLFTTGRQLKAARTLANVTQEALAAECGIHQKTVEYWEKREDATGMHDTFRRRVTEALLKRGVVFVSDPAPGACLDPSKAVPEREPITTIDHRRGLIYSPGEGFRTPD